MFDLFSSGTDDDIRTMIEQLTQQFNQGQNEDQIVNLLLSPEVCESAGWSGAGSVIRPGDLTKQLLRLKKVLEAGATVLVFEDGKLVPLDERIPPDSWKGAKDTSSKEPKRRFTVIQGGKE